MYRIDNIRWQVLSFWCKLDVSRPWNKYISIFNNDGQILKSFLLVLTNWNQGEVEIWIRICRIARTGIIGPLAIVLIVHSVAKNTIHFNCWFWPKMFGCFLMKLWFGIPNLTYLINVHARLTILDFFSTLHALIVCLYA